MTEHSFAPMPVAAVDIGTNSVRLLVTDASGRELARPMRITRLGQGVDVAGELSLEAIARTTAVLREYRECCDRHRVVRIRATATSAARDALNRDEFFDQAEQALGVRPQLLSGAEEARLSFAGATFDVPESAGPFLIMDIGGGSTELVVGRHEPEQVASLQLGCVRMTERHLHSDPASLEQLAACQRDVESMLLASSIDTRGVTTFVGLAGTVTALAAKRLGLARYDAARIHHSKLTLADVEEAFAELSSASLAERRSLLVEPQRADVIVGGVAVLQGCMRHFAISELLVSERDILDGLAASLRSQGSIT